MYIRMKQLLDLELKLQISKSLKEDILQCDIYVINVNGKAVFFKHGKRCFEMEFLIRASFTLVQIWVIWKPHQELKYFASEHISMCVS